MAGWIAGVALAMAGAGTAIAGESCQAWLEQGDAEVGGYSAFTRSALANENMVAASMVVLPSFDKEYAVSLARDGDRWRVRYSIVAKQIWTNPDPAPPIVRSREIDIAPDLARRIVSTWAAIIAHPIARDPDLIYGDGTNYVFSVDGHRATTWTPRCGLPLLAVQSAEALIVAAKAKTKRARESALDRIPVLLDLITPYTATADASH
jgi:hypothetical protein